MTAELHRQTSELTSLSLLAGLRQRDETAWAQFVTLYGPLIYSLCRRAGMSPENSGDLLQQILAKVWSGIVGFSKSERGSSFRGWLVVITQHTILDFIRAKEGKPEACGGTEAWQLMNQVPADLERSTQLINADLHHIAQRALHLVTTTLTTESRQLLELTVIQEKTATEAAALLNSTPAAVRKAKSRLLNRLREMLGEFD